MGKILFVLAVMLSFGAHAQQQQQQQSKYDAVQIKTHKITDSIYMLEGLGGNIGVSVGEDGVILIDDQYAPLTQRIVEAIKAITDKPIRFVINTHYHGDHTGGNENLGRMGVVIVAHDTVHKRLLAGGPIKLLRQNNPPAPRAALPIVTFNDKASLHVNGDEIIAHHIPPAHTDNDVFVQFRKANVIHTGDVFAAYRFPFIDVEHGGSVQGTIRAMDILLKMMDDETRVIPGHGPISMKKDVLAYRTMMVTVGGRIEKMVKAGMTMEQVVAAKPTREFDPVWSKFRTPDAFVEIAYYGYAPEKLKERQ